MDARAIQFQKNSAILIKYLPEQCVATIAQWIVEFDFKLKITKERTSRLGDYTSPRGGMNHQITINHNLNKYAFLITLVHEVAHLVTYNGHRDSVNPHGREWKINFQRLMQSFMSTDIFPVEVFAALRRYMQNPAASSCSDTQLLKTLKLYDEGTGAVFLEYLPAGCVFLYNGKRIFQKGERIRKRFKCTEIKTGNVYLFNPLAEVELFDAVNAPPS
jgi:SprT protein